MNSQAQTIRVESPVVEPTVETRRWAPVKRFSRLTTYIRGKEILILGPGKAGKTKFAQYLRWAALDPEGQREMTYAVTKSSAFVVNLGRAEGPELKVRRTVDTPGQVGPLQHALLVARRRPHAAIVMLDCSSDPTSTLRWFLLFCNGLDNVLRKASLVARRLQEIVVILNKRDKIENREYDKLQQAVRKVLERYLSVVWGEPRVRSIPILECISARTQRGTTLIDGVIAQLAERLAGRPDQPGATAGPRQVAASPAGPHPGPSCPSSGPAPAPSSPPRPPVAATPPVAKRPASATQKASPPVGYGRPPARSPLGTRKTSPKYGALRTPPRSARNRSR